MIPFKVFPRQARFAAVVTGAAVAAVLAITPATGLTQQTATVIVNGQTMTFDQPPIIQAGRVFVPMRAIFQQLGASVVYANGQINATARNRTISLTIGSTQATINGQSTTLDVAPFVVDARTLVPLRFVAQALGASVNWNDATSTVTIGGGGTPHRPPMPPPPAPVPTVTLTTFFPSGTIYNHYPQIRFQIDRPTRVALFTVKLDGQDITSGFQSNGQYFYAKVPFSLKLGTHRVRVYGRTTGGIPFDRNWTFNQGSP